MARHSAPVTRPWFIRSGSRFNCQLMPAAPAGWLLTGFYVLFAVAISALLLMGRDEPQLIEWAVWGLLLVVSTFAYLLTAWRTSEVRQGAGQCSTLAGACGRLGRDWNAAARALLIGLATALFILGAAWLGMEL